MNVKNISKISVKSVYGNIELEPVEVNDGKRTHTVTRAVRKDVLMRVVGSIDGYEQVTTTHGVSFRFKGKFRAVNVETGEVFDSRSMFLPSIAEEVLVSDLQKICEEIEPMKSGDRIVPRWKLSQTVEVGFDIGVEPASNNVGYGYTVASHKADNADDPLERMLTALPPIKMLPKSEG